MMKSNSNSNEADAAPDEDASVINLDELYNENENYSEDSISGKTSDDFERQLLRSGTRY